MFLSTAQKTPPLARTLFHLSVVCLPGVLPHLVKLLICFIGIKSLSVASCKARMVGAGVENIKAERAHVPGAPWTLHETSVPWLH